MKVQSRRIQRTPQTGVRLGTKFKRKPSTHLLRKTMTGINLSTRRASRIIPNDVSEETALNNIRTVCDEDILRRSEEILSSILTKWEQEKEENAMEQHPVPSPQKLGSKSSKYDLKATKLGTKGSLVGFSSENRTSFDHHDSRTLLFVPSSFTMTKSILIFLDTKINSCYSNHDIRYEERKLNLLAYMNVLISISANPNCVYPLAKLIDNVINVVSKTLQDAQIVFLCCAVLEALFVRGGKELDRLKTISLYNSIEQMLTSVLGLYEDTYSIHKVAVNILWAVSETMDGDPTIVNEEMLKVLLKAFCSTKCEPEVQFAIASLLQRFAIENSNEELIVRLNGVVELLEVAAKENVEDEVVKKICAAVWNLSFIESSKDTMLRSSCHELLKTIIKRYQSKRNRPDIVAKACAVLWNLADFTGAKAELMKRDVPQLLVETMRTFEKDAKIQENGCGCLRTLAYNDSSRISLMQIGAAERILRAMEVHLYVQGIQYQAFAVLKKLSCNDVNEGRLIGMGAGERILAAMEAHIDIGSIQERACGVLWNLAVKDVHKVKLISIGCAERMLEAMERHPKNEQVQFQTCRTLKRLARDSSNEVHLMKLGAAKHVLAAMRNHKDNASIQERGCGVLWNLSERDDHKRQLMELDAAKQILESMERHMNVENVQYEGCGALKRLAVDDEIEVMLMKMEAAKTVIKAMETHRKGSDVQGQACGVLWNLAFHGQSDLMKLGAPVHILKAMAEHSTNESVQEKACGTLWKLAEIDENNAKLMELGIVNSVLTAMDKIETHAGVQHQACGTLWNLAVKEQNRKPLLIARAEERVLCAMKCHPSRADIIHSSCGVLYNLAMGEVVIDKFMIKPKNPSAQVENELALQKLAKTAGQKSENKVTQVTNRVILASKGAIHSLVQALKVHPNNSDVMYQAITALSHIAQEPKAFVYFLERPSLLLEVVKATEKNIQDHGIQENTTVFLTKIMKNYANLLRMCINEKNVREKTKIPDATLLIRTTLSSLSKLSKRDPNNGAFSLRYISFFYYAFCYVSEQVGLNHKEEKKRQSVEKKRLRKSKRTKDSGSGGFFVFDGQQKDFFDESFAFAEKEIKEENVDEFLDCSEVFTKSILKHTLEKVSQALQSGRNEKGVGFSLKLVRRALTDATLYKGNLLFETFKDLILDASLHSKVAQVYVDGGFSKLQFESLYAMKMFIQLGSSDVIAEAFARKLPGQIVKKLFSNKKVPIHHKVVALSTLKLLVSSETKSKVAEQELSSFLAETDLVGFINSIILSAPETLTSDALKLQRSVLELLKVSQPLFETTYVSFCQREGLSTLLSLLEQGIKQNSSVLDLIDVISVLHNFSTFDKCKSAVVDNKKFKELLTKVIAIVKCAAFGQGHFGNVTYPIQSPSTKATKEKTKKKNFLKLGRKMVRTTVAEQQLSSSIQQLKLSFSKQQAFKACTLFCSLVLNLAKGDKERASLLYEMENMLAVLNKIKVSFAKDVELSQLASEALETLCKHVAVAGEERST